MDPGVCAVVSSVPGQCQGSRTQGWTTWDRVPLLPDPWSFSGQFLEPGEVLQGAVKSCKSTRVPKAEEGPTLCQNDLSHRPRQRTTCPRQSTQAKALSGLGAGEGHLMSLGGRDTPKLTGHPIPGGLGQRIGGDVWVEGSGPGYDRRTSQNKFRFENSDRIS